MNTKKSKSHGMSSSKASYKKKKGHEYEQEFADLIGGNVYGESSDKVDVIKGKVTYSVKTGKRSQIFLYAKSRFEKNTEFKGLELSNYFINCLSNRDQIIPNMKKLKQFLLDKKTVREAFFSKAFFNSNEVKKLAILSEEDKKFYIFERQDVLHILTGLSVQNSRGDRKVIFKSDIPIGKRKSLVNIGELEVRSDKRNILFVPGIK